MGHRLVFPVILLASSFSFSSLAGEILPGKQEAQVRAAKGWADYEAMMAPYLPSNVVKEFTVAAKDASVPRVQKGRYGLQIKSANGVKVRVRLLKEGEAEVNGKAWKVDPLVPVEKELQRLLRMILDEASGRKAELLWDLVMPRAVAGVEEDAFGVAAAAFATVYGWKAQQCGREGIAAELLKECVLMAAPIHGFGPADKVALGGLYGRLERASTGSGGETTNDEYMPVSYYCPKGNDSGELGLIFKNLNGESKRVRLDVKEHFPVKVYLDYAQRGEVRYKTIFQNPAIRPLDQNIEEVKKLIFAAFPVYTRICKGSREAQVAYQEKLDSNAEKIRRSASNRSGSEEEATPSINAI